MSLTRREIDKILCKLQSGDLTLLKQAIQKHPNINLNDLLYQQTGDSAIHILARLGTPENLQYVLQTFTPECVNYRNNDDKTPLHEAAQFSKYENVQFLIDNGADVNALKRSDWTPLMLACTKNNAESVKIAHLLIEHGASINHGNKDGWHALHFACKEGNTGMVKLLMKNAADVTIVTKNGRTPLHIAALHGHCGIVRELCEQKIIVNEKDCCGNTPFLEAVMGGSIIVCKLLLEKGASACATNSLGFGALHLAVNADNPHEMVGFLVNNLGFDVNAVSKLGLTPLHCAARANNRCSYDLLVSLGANKTLKDTFGRIGVEYFSVTN